MKPIAIICIVLGALILLYLGICAILIYKMFKPKKRTDEMLIEYETREKNFDKSWLDIPCEHLTMRSEFGYTLHGRFYKNPKRTDKIMISLHGHNNSGIGQMKYLNIFLDMGYNVFIPDHRRSGQSEGSYITFGAYEKKDVLAWINLLDEKFPAATFAIFGESMGAATAIMVTASDHRIRFLIEYCGYASIGDLVTGFVKYKAISRLLYPGMSIIAGAFYNVDLKECASKNAMAKIKVPVLMLHSHADKVVHFNNAEALHKANPKAEFHTFQESRHARSWVMYPDEFTGVLKDFIEKQDSKLN